MLNKMPIRLRLTVMSILLLTLCCLGLTLILNLSANLMANEIEAILVMPAQTVKSGEVPEEGIPAAGLTETVSGSQAARVEFLQNSMVYMLLVVALGGALTYYISGRALRPLRELGGQMKNRTVHNLSEALPVPESGDEIADLTRSFNEMSNKLDGAFAMQQRFAQSAAHELRTPLTVLKTKVEVFRKKPEHSPEEYDKLLSVIMTHTNRLADLVRELLTLANMDALDCGEVIALGEMLEQVSEELSGLAKEKNIAVTLEGESEMQQGNRSLLRRAFYNLVENAIKYNMEGGKVEIHVFDEGEHSVVSVADTGIGIPNEAQALVFEPFYRVDKSRSRQMGGAGLGLSTVKAIVEKHNGKITVGRNAGGGTVFKVTI